MDATIPEQRAATPRWPHLFTSGICAFYAYLLVWLALVVAAGSLVLGADAFVITSGSMEPRIRPGDVVLTVPTGATALDDGTVIAFRDPARNEQVVTHRIVGVVDAGYRTQGDASQAADPLPVPDDAVLGVGRMLVPFIGLPVVWAQGGDWLLLIGWGAATLLATHVALRPATPRSTPTPPAPRFPTIIPPPAATPTRPASGRSQRDRVGPRGVAGPAGRARPRGVSTAGVISVAVVSLAVGTASAAFTGSTASAGNSFAALGLDPPTGTSAACTVQGQNTSVTVTWTPPTTPYDGFTIHRTTASTGTSTVLGPVTGTTFTDTTAAQGETYEYAVASRLASWQSEPSVPASTSCQPGGGGPGGGPKGGGAAVPLSSPLDETSSAPLDEGSSTPTG